MGDRAGTALLQGHSLWQELALRAIAQGVRSYKDTACGRSSLCERLPNPIARGQGEWLGSSQRV